MNLSELEKGALRKLCTTVQDVKTIYDKNSDTIHNALRYQIESSTDDPKTLSQAISTISDIVGKLDTLEELSKLISDHFLVKKGLGE